MKTQKRITRAGLALTALAASVGLSSRAMAINFIYEDATSGHAIGSAFTGGGFRINLQNFDNGTVYPSPLPGGQVGFGAGGGAANVAAGIAALNAVPGQVGPTGGLGGEDTWGIARILTITDLAGAVIWSESGKNAQITAIFYGEQDFYVSQLAGGLQNIDGVGLRTDFYLQSKAAPGFTDYNPLLGSGGRIDQDSYQTVTDSNGTLASAGVPFLTTVSVANFIHNTGVLGGLATEFNSTYNASSGGQGQAYLRVTGGTDAAQFDTNTFVSAFAPGAERADLFAQFTTTALIPPNTVADWLVRSNDPIAGFIPSGVPESGSSLLMLGLGLAFLAEGYRRRRQHA
jgi:hypothetical protein